MRNKKEYNQRCEELCDKFADHFGPYDNKSGLHSLSRKGRTHAKHAFIRKLYAECPPSMKTLKARCEYIAPLVNMSYPMVRTIIQGYGVGCPTRAKRDAKKREHKKVVAADSTILDLWDALGKVTKKVYSAKLFPVGKAYSEGTMTKLTDKQYKGLDYVYILIEKAMQADGPERKLFLQLNQIAKKSAEKRVPVHGDAHDDIRESLVTDLLDQMLIECATAIDADNWDPDALIERIEEKFAA